MDRTEATIRKKLYWPDIRNDVRMEVTNCDTCKHTKPPHKKYSRLPAKLAEVKPRNKLCVELIVSYGIRRKVKKKNLHLKSVTMIDSVT